MKRMAIRTRSRRLYLPMIATLLLSGGMLAALPTSASATPLLTCSGAIFLKMEPGLTDTPQEIRVRGVEDLTSCTNLENIFEERTGKIPILTAVVKFASCGNFASLLKGEDQTEIDWSNGKTSNLGLVTDTTAQVGPVTEVDLADLIETGEFVGGTADLEDALIMSFAERKACEGPGGLNELLGSSQVLITV